MATIYAQRHLEYLIKPVKTEAPLQPAIKNTDAIQVALKCASSY